MKLHEAVAKGLKIVEERGLKKCTGGFFSDSKGRRIYLDEGLSHPERIAACCIMGCAALGDPEMGWEAHQDVGIVYMNDRTNKTLHELYEYAKELNV